jgi:hypothetical protein
MACDLQSLNFELAGLKPPIPRDRLIFEEVMVKGRSQLEVAGEHGISQPRVSIIVGEVTAWLCRVLPESAMKEGAAGQVALGFWLARARLEFLYNKALAAFDASGQDKVTYKERRRTEVACEEKITRQQTPSVGLFNGALRAAVASARMCTAAAKSSGVSAGRQSAGMSPESPVMSNSAKTAELSPGDLPQTQAAQDLTNVNGHSSEDRETMLQTVIKILRESPQRAHWTDADFRDAAERRLAILDAAHREQEEQQRQTEAAKEVNAASSSPKHEQKSISLVGARAEKLRRERERRKRPEERRREFLAPLAAG